VLSAPSRFGLTEVNFSELQSNEREDQMIEFLAGRMQLAMRDEEGQALVEYALVVSLIAVVSIAALTLAGTSISGILNTIASNV
jgi:pilus assembly protein Flp/PilA